MSWRAMRKRTNPVSGQTRRGEDRLRIEDDPQRLKPAKTSKLTAQLKLRPFKECSSQRMPVLKECPLGRVLQKRVNRGFPQTVDEAASTLLEFSSRGVPVRGASRVLRRTAGSRAIRDGP